MNGGDPVEEGGQATRASFIQAMQTAAMTMNFLQRRGAESRSATEHQERMADHEADRRRSGQVHDWKIAGYRERAAQGAQQHWSELQIKAAKLTHDQAEAARRAAAHTADQARRDQIHDLQTQGYTERSERGQQLHDLDVATKTVRLDAAGAAAADDAAARTTERARRTVVHHRQVDGYDTRARHAAEAHDLDVEYKKLLIEIRRRAAGFADDLAGGTRREDYTAAASDAAFAATDNTAGMSQEHRTYSDAYRERFTTDTDGSDPDQIIDAEIVEDVDESAPEPGPAPAGAQADATTVEGPVDIDVEAVADLAAELTHALYVEHEMGTATDESGPTVTETGDGAAIGDAIDAATGTGDLVWGVQAGGEATIASAVSTNQVPWEGIGP